MSKNVVIFINLLYTRFTIKQTIYAEYEEDAFLFQRIVEKLHGYHKYVKPISEIVCLRRIVVGYTKDQAMVVTIPADHLHWTERADIGSEELIMMEHGDLPIKRKELWVTGSLTSRAKHELQAKGIAIREGIGDWLLTK